MTAMLLLLTAASFAATPALSVGFTQGAGVGYTDSPSAGTVASVDATLPFHPLLGLSGRVATALSFGLPGDPNLNLALRPQVGLRFGRDVGLYATAWVGEHWDDTPTYAKDGSEIGEINASLSVGYLVQPGENLQWGPELQVGTEGAYLGLAFRWGTAEVKLRDASEG